MKSIIKMLACVLLGGLTVMLIACDTTTGPDSTSKDGEEILIPRSQKSSRVFDGRDSLTTGNNGPAATKAYFAVITEFLEIGGGDDDVGRVGITNPDNLDPSTLLFESREGNPILTPDGEQVTWGLFSNAKGGIIVKCMTKGTHVTVHLAGLIPNAVYTIQNKLFDPGSGDLIGQIGFTAQAQSKTRNSFRTSAKGEGHISGFIKPGALGMDVIGNCMLDDATNYGAYVWRTVAVYQMDGTPELDKDGTFVEQGGFTFNVWQ